MQDPGGGDGSRQAQEETYPAPQRGLAEVLLSAAGLVENIQTPGQSLDKRHDEPGHAGCNDENFGNQQGYCFHATPMLR